MVDLAGAPVGSGHYMVSGYALMETFFAAPDRGASPQSPSRGALASLRCV